MLTSACDRTATIALRVAPGRIVEGRWDGHVIVIEFATRALAHAWYESAAYREILSLRTDNSVSDVVLVDTVSADHRAKDVLRA